MKSVVVLNLFAGLAAAMGWGHYCVKESLDGNILTATCLRFNVNPSLTTNVDLVTCLEFHDGTIAVSPKHGSYCVIS
jgi:hypothetical protein